MINSRMFGKSGHESEFQLVGEKPKGNWVKTNDFAWFADAKGERPILAQKHTKIVVNNEQSEDAWVAVPIYVKS